MPCVDICDVVRTATSILEQLHAPKCYMQCHQGPDKSTDPTVEPYELVGMQICEKRYGENCERRPLESEEDAKREEGKSHETCPVPRAPPGFMDGILGDIFGNGRPRRTVEQPQPVRGSNIVGSYEGEPQRYNDQRGEREELRVGV